MPLSYTEENYLKAIYKLAEIEQGSVSTNAIAKMMSTSAASVTDMIKRLSEKGYLKYRKYYGSELTNIGKKTATQLVRKHRLWETFLVDKLKFSWEEIHDIAEELEHIKSDKLIQRLDDFLGFPKFDPHGDPIPNPEGKFTLRSQIVLSEMKVGEQGQVIGVKTHDTPFLQHLNNIGIRINTPLRIVSKQEYDNSTTVKINETNILLSEKVATQLLLKKIS
jgi:DtxR family Mn-dependent transcriptional regulator